MPNFTLIHESCRPTRRQTSKSPAEYFNTGGCPTGNKLHSLYVGHTKSSAYFPYVIVLMSGLSSAISANVLDIGERTAMLNKPSQIRLPLALVAYVVMSLRPFDGRDITHLEYCMCRETPSNDSHT